MKINSYLLAPLCAAMAIFAFGSCSDEQIIDDNGGRPEGNGIVFGASTGYAGAPGSKTAYGDYDDPDAPTSQEILWVAGDRVDVYSPTSPSMTKAEYEISGIGLDNDEGRGYLAAIEGRNGLQWDKGSATQDFYAVYPSKASMSNQAIANQYVSFENGKLRGFIPVNQQHTITKTGEGTYTATPNMDWQYMVAETEGFTVPQDGTDGGVTLNFKPIVTTLEITIVGNGNELPLSQLNVEAPEGTVIMGQFMCDLVEGNVDEDGMPVCEFLQSGTTTNFVTVSLYDTDNAPITLGAGEELTLNVFLLPVNDLTDISIRLAGFNTGSKTLKLAEVVEGQSTNITLEKHKKTRVRISEPDLRGAENQWISGIDDDVLVSQLSIPGTANSFSYQYEGDNTAWYQTQTATFEEQWNAGIRCFELVGEQYKNGDDLRGARLLCNRTSVNMTFGEAVDMIWQKVQGTGEFAMIIPSYDSDTGHPADGNGVLDYAEDLNNFYTNNPDIKYVTYSSTLTVGEARGGLLFIARITSEEDADRSQWDREMPAPVQGVFVDQWGSLKDNWARRGYTLEDGTVVNNWSTGNNDQNSVEYYMNTSYQSDDDSHKDTYDEPSFIPSRDNKEVNFVHATTREGGSTGQAYVQDWQRVVYGDGEVPAGSEVTGLRSGSFFLGQSRDGYWFNYTYTNYYTYWRPSLAEKQTDIWNTYKESIGMVDHAEQFYINSLDGYFVDPNIQDSYLPYVAGGTWGVGLSGGGTGGNIKAYGNLINNWFYNKILDFGVTNVYGPMNIILMDYVYDGTAGGDRLPSTIINNNFRFPLITASETNSFGDGGTSMGNGGSAIE